VEIARAFEDGDGAVAIDGALDQDLVVHVLDAAMIEAQLDRAGEGRLAVDDDLAVPALFGDEVGVAAIGLLLVAREADRGDEVADVELGDGAREADGCVPAVKEAT